MAGNLSIKQDLLKLKGAVLMNIKGKGGVEVECLVIPVEIANLYKGASAVYLDSTALPLNNPKAGSKDTHLVKQSFGKDKFNAMSEQEKKDIPIMGNVIDWDKANGTSSTPSPATQSTPPTWL